MITRTADCCSVVGSVGGASLQATLKTAILVTDERLLLWVTCSASSRAEYDIYILVRVRLSPDAQRPPSRLFAHPGARSEILDLRDL